VIDAIELQLIPFDRGLTATARLQFGCRTLIRELYGVGALTPVTILAELGDVRRFANSRDVVRYAGMGVTVHQSDDHRAPGHPAHQGPPAMRWALYEAAQRAGVPASPDRG
jgi:transposase